MYQFSTILIILSTLMSLSALAASLPIDLLFNKRDEQSGKGTWFYDGLGACGATNVDSDLIVALSTELYGTGANCGLSVRVTNTANGNTAVGTVCDRCESCGPYDLDMSVGLFQQLGPLSAGVLPIIWEFE